MLFKKISSLILSLGLTISSASGHDMDSVYEIKSKFIETLDKAATIHSRDLDLRRGNLLRILDKKEQGFTLSKSDELFMDNLARRYEVESGDISSLLLATDKVPTGIIISVAIRESDWGTNKKMKDAKNPFGIRCFSIDCGISDENSELDDVYSELRVFDSYTDATRAFAKNININTQYSAFREVRKDMRERGEYLTSLPLAEYVTPFAEYNSKYGTSLRKIIHENKLYYLDE